MIRDLAVWFAEHPAEFMRALNQHLILCGLSMAIALVVGLPLAVAISARERLSLVVINSISALRTVPSLAILAVMMPFLGIGRWPCVVALTILALPPIVINSVAGLRGVDPDLMDAAAGMGMRPRQILWRVQAPLAASAMFAGVRTALVQVLAGAALAPFIGGGGLGDFITTGIGLRDTTRLLAGAIPIALMALTAEGSMALAEKALFGGKLAAMITLEGLTKRYSADGPAAVESVSMSVPEGQTAALIGPSGCGKTTTLRMINRLIEPTAGRIVVGGEDVTSIDPVLLRRRIGYVIQQAGLFPHMTTAQNIAVVPKLLGWSEARISARTDELLDLVGLDPAAFRQRYAWQLSGGQRQRVGVARALAADPPVLLMDEPFGAIDPVARLRLQDEFRLILSKVKKTVVLVTHDLDEAIKMGDRLAIMRAGRLVQYDTPEAVLSNPADAFVAEFVGADGPLKRLGLVKVDALLSAEGPSGAGPRLMLGASLREALALMVAGDLEAVAVDDAQGRLQGYVHRSAIFAA